MLSRALVWSCSWLLLTAAGTVLEARSGAIRSKGGVFVPTIHSITFGPWQIYGNGMSTNPSPCISADNYANTWADDGNIYVQYNDTYGGWNSNSANSANFSVSTIGDYTLATPNGTLVNSMAASFGTMTQYGSDGADYKTSGPLSVHGALYMLPNRQYDSAAPHGWLATQIIQSVDHGGHWTPLPPAQAQPYASPTWSDPKFRMPIFVKYGTRDYTGQTKDGSDQYVYAVSIDQSGAHQSSYRSDQVMLGRVPVSAIGNLLGSDWTYYQGGDGNVSGNWGALSTAVPVMSTPGTFTFSGYGEVMYLSAFDQYLYWAQTDGGVPTTTWTPFVAKHIWGPYAKLGSPFTWNPQGYGLMASVEKSITLGPPTTYYMFANGNFSSSTYYTLYSSLVTVN